MRIPNKRAFTLIELLTVIAIIAILTGILVPSVSIAQAAVKRAQSKTTFASWMNALEQYKQVYGHYPKNFFDKHGVFSLAANNNAFVAALSGRELDGKFSDNARKLNRKGICFYTFSNSDFNENHELADAFGNPNIFVVIDNNNDGLIEKSNETFASNVLMTIPNNGIRGSMVAYSIKGEAIEYSDVLSWK